MKPFVIITPGRSGSTFLAKTLNQHPEISCEEEIFNRSQFYKGTFNHFLSSNPIRRTLAFFFNREQLSTTSFNLPLRWLLLQFLKSKKQDVRNYGFKISLDQLFAYPQLFSILKPNFLVLYLSKADKLRVVLSLLAARKTGSYETFSGEKVVLDPVKVKSSLRTIQRQEKQCKAFFLQRLDIGTNDLFNNSKVTFQRIQRFLSLEKEIESGPSKQLRSDNLSEWVENIDEIEMYLKTSN